MRSVICSCVEEKVGNGQEMWAGVGCCGCKVDVGVGIGVPW